MWKSQEEEREGGAEGGGWQRSAVAQEATRVGRNAENGEKGARQENAAEAKEMVPMHGTWSGLVAAVGSRPWPPTPQEHPQG